MYIVKHRHPKRRNGLALRVVLVLVLSLALVLVFGSLAERTEELILRHWGFGSVTVLAQ